MKKLSIFVLTALLFAGCLPSLTAFAEAEAESYARVTQEGVYFYRYADESAGLFILPRTSDIYVTAEQEGIFKATLDYKRWGRNRNVLAYFTLEDGRKIMASAWQDTGYLGIPEIPMGATVRLTFQKAKNGLAYLRGVEEEK